MQPVAMFNFHPEYLSSNPHNILVHSRFPTPLLFQLTGQIFLAGWRIYRDDFTTYRWPISQYLGRMIHAVIHWAHEHRIPLD